MGIAEDIRTLTNEERKKVLQPLIKQFNQITVLMGVICLELLKRSEGKGKFNVNIDNNFVLEHQMVLSIALASKPYVSKQKKISDKSLLVNSELAQIVCKLFLSYAQSEVSVENKEELIEAVRDMQTFLPFMEQTKEKLSIKVIEKYYKNLQLPVSTRT